MRVLTHLPSISSTFYAHVFRTKFWRQKTQVLCAAFLVTFWQKSTYIQKTKNARKKCWWIWHLESISPKKIRVTFALLRSFLVHCLYLNFGYESWVWVSSNQYYCPSYGSLKKWRKIQKGQNVSKNNHFAWLF